MGDEPDFNLLVTLRALLEEANVTRAAGRMGVGQSTMSSSLARLREQFGDELLVRVGREFELTPLARQLLPQVQRAVPLIERALGQADIFEPAASSRVFRILLSDYMAIELQPLWALIALATRSISIEMVNFSLASGRTDYELLSYDFIVAPPGTGVEGESVELSRDEYVVIADRRNPAVQNGTITLEDFQRLPHARCDFGHGVLSAADRRARELSLAVDVRVMTSTMLPIPLIVTGTDLIAMIPSRLHSRASGAVDTVAVPPPFGPISLTERLWWHSSKNVDDAHAWFRGLVAELNGGSMLTQERNPGP